MPDPKLKTAMEQIKAVLKKHDIGGIVVLGSQTHTQFSREYTPTWTCISLEEHDGKTVLRVKALRKDFSSLEAHKKCLEDSMGLLAGFADAIENEREQLVAVLLQIAKTVQFEHVSKLE